MCRQTHTHTPPLPQGLTWVGPGRRTLAVLAAPSLLLLWDTRGAKYGQVVWKANLGAEPFTRVAADPHDVRRLVVTSPSGAFVVVMVEDAAKGEVQVSPRIAHSGCVDPDVWMRLWR